MIPKDPELQTQLDRERAIWHDLHNGLNEVIRVLKLDLMDVNRKLDGAFSRIERQDLEYHKLELLLESAEHTNKKLLAEKDKV